MMSSKRQSKIKGKAKASDKRRKKEYADINEQTAFLWIL